MDRVSMRDGFSDLKQRLVEKLEVKRRKYVFKNEVGKYFDYVKENLSVYGKAYGKYVLFEFVPYVVAYGLLFNIPAAVFFGMALTVETVTAWGFVGYILTVEVPSVFNEVKPYVRVTAKVDS